MGHGAGAGPRRAGGHRGVRGLRVDGGGGHDGDGPRNRLGVDSPSNSLREGR